MSILEKSRYTFSFLFLIVFVFFNFNLKASDNCEHIKNDLQVINQILALNSSNYNYSLSNQNIFDLFYRQALNKSCNSDLDYLKILKTYIASFADPHLNLSINIPVQRVSTGIILLYSNQKLYVYSVDNKLLADQNVMPGLELVSCDGKSALEILDKEVLSLYPVTDLEAARFAKANYFFYRWDKLENDRSICSFKKGSEVYKQELIWKKDFNQDLWTNYLKRYFDRDYTYRMEETGYGAWVSLSGMFYQNDNELMQLKKFISDTDLLKKKKNLVLDLRTNGGGNSDWASKWIKGIWGYEPPSNDKSSLVFASKGNEEHFRTLLEKEYVNGNISENDIQELRVWFDCMKNNQNKFVNFNCSEILDPPLIKNKSNAVKGFPKINLVTPKVYLLTDANCFSSCEIFVRELKKMPNVIHVGEATNASTLFGDIRRVQIPNSPIYLTFPQKIFFWSGDGAIKPDIKISLDIDKEISGRDSIKDQIENIINSSRNSR
ncbi:MAG: hypothetical protein HQK49_09535 [Oligoflexia bacterium]|nr:hypothetical protein [Oligoflexia bacterium]